MGPRRKGLTRGRKCVSVDGLADAGVSVGVGGRMISMRRDEG